MLARFTALAVLPAAIGGVAFAGGTTPPGYTVAFIGDQGLGPDAVAVLELIQAEGADCVVHAGDFDYGDDPAAWEAQIDSVLGPAFPYFASAGNHDELAWCGFGGYQNRLEQRLARQGIAWQGDLGVQSTIVHEGLVIAQAAPGTYGCGDGAHDAYLRDVFGADNSAWRIASWHKNMRRMQVGEKPNETGWGVYEEARRAGAIIATAHEHSYSRTHLLADMSLQLVASTSQTLVLKRDDPATGFDEGRSFAFVSGLGGRSVREQVLGGEWWASIYTATQGATHGALFGVFHDQGDPCLARFYFKDIDGVVADEFLVVSTMGPCGDGDLVDGDPPVLSGTICDSGGACIADLTGDGVVNDADLDLVLDLVGCCPDIGDCPGDVVRNGFVGALDVVEVIVSWGVCPNVDTCPWDVNGDDVVDVADFVATLLNLGSCGPECPWDFDLDGQVDILDLAILILNWGECPKT